MEWFTGVFESVMDVVSNKDPLIYALSANVAVLALVGKIYQDKRSAERSAGTFEEIAKGCRAQHELARSELQDCQADNHSRKKVIEKLEDRVQRQDQAHHEQVDKISRLEHELAYAQGRIKNFDALVAKYEEHAAALSTQALELSQASHKLQLEKDKVDSELHHQKGLNIGLMKRLNADSDERQKRIGKLLDDRGQLRAEVAQLEDLAEVSASELKRERSRREGAEARAVGADPERLAALSAEIARLRADLSAREGGMIDRLLDELEADESGKELWARPPFIRPSGYDDRLSASKPVMMIGNLKGGVGKTTLAANLAAHYHSRDERVLLIDLDYQSSLTAMTTQPSAGAVAQVRSLFMRKPVEPVDMNGVPGGTSAVIDCYYGFSERETTIMLQWLANREGVGDVRFRLADYLLSDAVQDRFDRVVIDTAPRISTAFVNALCAATHLLIPTRLDVLSAETVERFLAKLRDDLAVLRPLQLSSVRSRSKPVELSFQIVGTMKRIGTAALSAGEADAIARIHSALDRLGADRRLFLGDAFVPTRAGFAKEAGYGIAYFSDPEVRLFIDRLANQIEPFAPVKWSLAA